MNKQELIERIECLKNIFGNKNEYVKIDMVVELLSELDDPPKVTIPQFVADYIEFAKKHDWNLRDVFLDVGCDDPFGSDVFNWLYKKRNNIDVLARAWLDGYLTEEETEIWKQVPGYYNEVSNFGNVRSINHKAGNGKTYQGKNLKPVLTNSGYVNINLITGNDKDRIVKRVHRLVAELFIPNPDGKDEVNHIDGNKQNNRADNLEWVTRNENEQHAYDTGLITILKGSEKPLAKLTENDVIKIREEYAKGCLQIELASKYGVARQTISSIVNRKAWTHV